MQFLVIFGAPDFELGIITALSTGAISQEGFITCPELLGCLLWLAYQLYHTNSKILLHSDYHAIDLILSFPQLHFITNNPSPYPHNKETLIGTRPIKALESLAQLLFFQ